MAITFHFNGNKIQIFKVFSDTLTEIVPMHSHPKNGYELHLIDDGKGVLETADKKYLLYYGSEYAAQADARHKKSYARNMYLSENP